MFRAIDSIRDGLDPDAASIEEFVAATADGSASDAHIAAFAMAVFCNGLGAESTAHLTNAMAASGDILDWSWLPAPVSDKHSTGGVGDGVSLVLAPAVAACGVYVPMISGAGLGHTGGTLDKLSSIPGYTTKVDLETFRQTVQHAGCAIVGQTSSLAPADGRIYGVRDVTGTVASTPLITASILSKKLAGIGFSGNRSLVMDVKYGNGAFMQTGDEARALGESLQNVANAAGLPTGVVYSDMNQPLSPVAGNAVEMAFALDLLMGRRPERSCRFYRLVVELGAQMLFDAKVVDCKERGRANISEAIASGEAGSCFQQMAVSLGAADASLEEMKASLPSAPVTAQVVADRSGVVSEIKTTDVGNTVVGLGGGRRHVDDVLDYSVGLSEIVELGESVTAGEPICTVHARDLDEAASAISRLQSMFILS